MNDQNLESLELFEPLIGKWFTQKFGRPTEIQKSSWREISCGKHVLITAPTGSGKTLASLLWALNQLLSGAWPPGATSILYVSPLKALNNDIRRNLLEPLAEIKEAYAGKGMTIPDIQVFTRSGDTPQYERQRMLRHPPEILITTPESLNLILSSKRARLILTTIKCVILDEIHALASTKRGTHLITAVERLVPLAGEFQRIALSATVKPLKRIGAFIGGYRLKSGENHYEPRQVSILQSPESKRFEIGVSFIENAREALEDKSWWPALVKKFKEIISENHSTLLFTNSRRLCEKLTRLINEGEERELAYSHHGSLSKEIRRVVEQRLKRGELAAIVATSSLELGIDIGTLDQVILVQTPVSISSGVQRIGRAGHSVGEVSRGSLYPTHGRDFLEAAIMARSIVEQDIEEAKPVTTPLDVLAQVIISMTGVEEWDVDELYNFLRCCYAYQKLPRKHFNLVIEMLAGRYSESRIRELKARVYLDRLDNRIQAKSGALSLIYHSGGTIPDRGYFNLRLQGSKAKIGELDEEFVWERRAGDSFTLAAQSWKITNITHQDVEVVPGKGQVNYLPFWKAEKENRDFHFSEKIALFLEEWNGRLNSPEFDLALKESYLMDRAAISELKSFLLRQREKTGTDLPHRHHLLIEYGDMAMENSGNRRVIAHTQWGGRVNHPLALAFSGAWEEKFSCHLEVIAGNDSIMFLLPADFDILQLFDLVKPDNLERLLRKKLESSGFFGARFRQNAGRALLLPRSGFQKRMPLWHTRLRSKKLFESVSGYEDFPVLLETWRTCLQDEFDLENLKKLLQELQSGKIKCTAVKTSLFSPFAANLVWQQQDKHIYQSDSAFTGSISRLSDDLLKEVALSAYLRPHLDPRLVKEFKQKLQRTAPGYSPPTPIELLDWVKERLLMPEPEWQELLEAVERDHQLDPKEMLESINSKVRKISIPGASVSSIAAVELLPRVLSALQLSSKEAVVEPLLPATATDLNSFSSQVKIRRYDDEEAKEQLLNLTAEWLRFYGPLQAAYVGEVFGFGAPVLRNVTNSLAESSIIVIDRFTSKSRTLELCDVENLETLLRLTRVKARPDFEAVELKELPLFLAMINGFTCKGESGDVLENILELLFGYPAPAQLWERDIFTARLKAYYSSHLDNLLQQSELQWFGCGRQRIGFCFTSDMDLFNDNGADNEHWVDVESLFAHRRGVFSFWDILDSGNQSSERLTSVLWEKVWQGKISNDSFAVLRRGLENKFKMENAPDNKGRRRDRSGRTGGRYSFNRWKASRPFSGNWYSLRPEEYPLDALEREEVIKERVRQLFRRYGILFKQILENELPFLRWSKIFRTLRIMELSGEILSGYFFKGLPGLQFMSHTAFSRLRNGLPRDAIYWLNAVDPVSTCGLKLDNLPGNLPSRLPSTHLVYHGNKLVLVSRRGGRILRIFVPPESPHFTEYLQFFKTLITRDYKPQKYIRVESINDLEVNLSPYCDELCRFGFVKDYKTLTLYG